ncbi:hypothetical protein [Thiomicrospira cyclica]|uniref:Prevent-host-death family protein n=1 Tax=Thiomicrospira cyclica (strain DSM 14477 / JCM 11371 / ALM1) TaxID=717773 RepID=F6DAT6_THICA|nr:hypothetical protein [Thiomicrospira cyclica]AEG31179.1 hypothetical protein Thicy_0405 [Thiomicrospira cyclica ALM1]
MQRVNSSDILRKPALLSSSDVLYIEDGRKHILKSVLLPIDLYETVREQIEAELYLRRNAKALDAKAYAEFSETEQVVEDLAL